MSEAELWIAGSFGVFLVVLLVIAVRETVQWVKAEPELVGARFTVMVLLGILLSGLINKLGWVNSFRLMIVLPALVLGIAWLQIIVYEKELRWQAAGLITLTALLTAPFANGLLAQV